MEPKRILLLTISTIAVVVIWFALYIPESEKLHSNFQVYLEQEGEDQIADKIGGNLSQPFALRESLIQKVIATNGEYVKLIAYKDARYTDILGDYAKDTSGTTSGTRDDW